MNDTLFADASEVTPCSRSWWQTKKDNLESFAEKYAKKGQNMYDKMQKH